MYESVNNLREQLLRLVSHRQPPDDLNLRASGYLSGTEAKFI
jgi:hypothetical protein